MAAIKDWFEAWWFTFGECYLSSTGTGAGGNSVMEGWIGRLGNRVAAAEFEQRGHRYVVAAGGEPNGRLGSQLELY